MARRTGDARPVGERLDAYFDVGVVLTGRNGSSPKGETKHYGRPQTHFS
jgi:hypothetical protein